ncbi:MAG: hypothetical protein JWM34_1496 [Ilumatobacteraceae bacterium]|nr:hypothetical protein [Ilumatobacteraceae bacterium]
MVDENVTTATFGTVWRLRMSHVHAIVWLDHREARVISFSLGEQSELVVHAHQAEQRIHHKAGSIGSGHTADDHHFFDAIALALVGTHEVLIAGPGNAKTAFETYIRDRHVDLAGRVVGVETLDHPTDAELLAHARQAFTSIDQLGHSQR